MLICTSLGCTYQHTLRLRSPCKTKPERMLICTSQGSARPATVFSLPRTMLPSRSILLMSTNLQDVLLEDSRPTLFAVPSGGWEKATTVLTGLLRKTASSIRSFNLSRKTDLKYILALLYISDFIFYHQWVPTSSFMEE